MDGVDTHRPVELLGLRESYMSCSRICRVMLPYRWHCKRRPRIKLARLGGGLKDCSNRSALSFVARMDGGDWVGHSTLPLYDW